MRRHVLVCAGLLALSACGPFVDNGRGGDRVEVDDLDALTRLYEPADRTLKEAFRRALASGAVKVDEYDFATPEDALDVLTDSGCGDMQPDSSRQLFGGAELAAVDGNNAAVVQAVGRAWLEQGWQSLETSAGPEGHVSFVRTLPGGVQLRVSLAGQPYLGDDLWSLDAETDCMNFSSELRDDLLFDDFYERYGYEPDL